MMLNCRARIFSFLFVGLYFFSATASSVHAAGQYLVGDRTLGRVLRYSDDGAFLGTLINDPTLGVGLGSNDGGITGLTLSPDQSRLYVSDRLSNRVAVYSYTGNSASHLFDITAVTAAPSTLFVPATVLFSQDASKIYVGNLGPFSPLPVGRQSRAADAKRLERGSRLERRPDARPLGSGVYARWRSAGQQSRFLRQWRRAEIQFGFEPVRDVCQRPA